MRRSLVLVVDPSRPRDGMIVAAPNRDEESLCIGESGAPLVADLGAGAAVFGVFSSVDAYVNPSTGEMVELCDGFEARSYFTSVTGMQSWIDGGDRGLRARSGGLSGAPPESLKKFRRHSAAAACAEPGRSIRCAPTIALPGSRHWSNRRMTSARD